MFNGLADSITTLSKQPENAADILALTRPRMDAVYIGSASIDSLTDLNSQLNALFKVAQ